MGQSSSVKKTLVSDADLFSFFFLFSKKNTVLPACKVSLTPLYSFSGLTKKKKESVLKALPSSSPLSVRLFSFNKLSSFLGVSVSGPDYHAAGDFSPLVSLSLFLKGT